MRIAAFALAALALGIAGCTQVATEATKLQTKAAAAVGNVATLTTADLNNAIALANAQSPPDQISATCYKALVPYVAQAEAAVSPPGVTQTGAGVFTGLQVSRDVATQVQTLGGPLPQALQIACGPLLMSEVATINDLLAKLGIAAVIAAPKL